MSDATSQALLDTAGRAAAAGRYATARALLATLETAEPPIDAVLLRARMAAQQGRFDEAIDRFREALLAEPGNREAREGLEKVRTLKRWPAGRFVVRAKASLILVCALSVPLILGLFGRGPGAPPAAQRESALPPEIVAPPAPSPVPRASEDGPTSSQAPPSRLPALELEQPGVILRREGDQLIVTFERGLFASGEAEPAAEAADTLRALARALAVQPASLTIAVEGHTDDVPLAPGSPFRDNQELGLARAVAVISFLCREARLPWSRFSGRGLGVERAPYPSAEPSARARNRTVVLRLEKGTES